MSIQDGTFLRLVVDELVSTLSQSVEFSATTTLERAMLHLFIDGSPTGTVTARIKDGATVLSECSLELATLPALTGKTKRYYHGYISFQFPKPPILSAGTYTLELSAGTYSFGSNWIGWVKLPSDPAQTNPFTYPLNFSLVDIRTA